MSDTETNRRAVEQFLQRHGLAAKQFSSQQLLADYLDEMATGLAQPAASSLKMIPSYVSPDRHFQRNQAVLVLDAGGTNLRCALVTLPYSGVPMCEHSAKRQMPALQQVLSGEAFFAEIAEFMAPCIEEYYLRYKQGPACLGFCFSYPSQIAMGENGDLDGQLLQWTKEVKVPELVGQYIGSGLLALLRRKFGAKAPEHVCVINDTVATLLAGQSAAEEEAYSDFIGYILGTGINSCYAETCQHITRLDTRYRAARTIVNMEAGNYSRFPQSQIDREYDRLTQHPGTYLQEKACSGRYWGELVCVLLRTAATEGILPPSLATLPLQSSATLNAVLECPSFPSSRPSSLEYSVRGIRDLPSPLVLWLDEYDIGTDARERIYFLTEAMLERSALFSAVNMAACILRSGGGHSPLRPICLTVDGSTFYTLYYFELRTLNWLKVLLREQPRYYRIKRVENAPLLGAAIAALGFGA